MNETGTYKVHYKDGRSNIIIANLTYLKNDPTIIKYEKISEEKYKKNSIEQLQQENKLLKAQLKAQTERSDFIEDCIAEMAGVVYNTEETTT